MKFLLREIVRTFDKKFRKGKALKKFGFGTKIRKKLASGRRIHGEKKLNFLRVKRIDNMGERGVEKFRR